MFSMKPEHPSDDDKRLHELLQDWRVEAPLPPRFQEGVWRKIARADAAAPSGWRRGWDELIAGWTALLRRPVGAVAYLSALLLVGTVLGYWQSDRFGDQKEMAWRAAYVQSVYPYSTRSDR